MAIRDVASAELESQAKQGKFVGPAAQAVERILTRFRPVTRWKVIGPAARTTATVFGEATSIDFEKKLAGAGGRAIAWQDRPGDPVTGRVVIEDLKGGAGDNGGFGYDANNSPDLAAFAYAEVTSDRDRAALMLVGSSGSILVTVNDQPLLNHNNAIGRPYATDSDVVRFPLKKGKNTILIMSRQGIGTWSFGVLISEPSRAGIAVQASTVTLEGLRAFALSHQGDARNGETIFFEAKGVGCARCHAVGGQGTAGIGPDLTGLANKYQKPEIIRSVLEPSNRLATGFQPLLISKRDGTVVTGMLRTETDDALEMVDAEGKPFRVEKFEIDERKVSDISLMPAGLVDSLSPVEFADLISYLASLKAKE
jgi:putative heme-binding domain-containing protein